MAGIGDVIYGGTEGRQFEAHTLVPTANNRGRFDVGTQMVFGDGRKFRYAILPTGGATLVRGSLYQAAANTANHVGLTPTAAAVSVAGTAVNTVTVTLGATAAVTNEYAGGYLHVNQGTAGGSYYLIASHPAAAASATLVLTLATGIAATAIPATAASIDLIHNKLFNPLIVPTTKTQTVVGVAMSALTAGQGGWIQTAGPCSVLTQGTLVVGNYAITSATTAGAVSPGGAAAVTDNQVGVVMRVGATAAWSLIDLKLDN